jgi:hypothetical protein
MFNEELLNEEFRTNSTTRACSLRAILQNDEILVSGKTQSWFQKQVAIFLAMKHAGKKFQIKTKIQVGVHEDT